MLLKHALITVATVWVLIFGCALGIAIHRHDMSFKSWMEYTWGISFAAVIVGLLLRSGATKGDTIERTEGVIMTSLDREGYMEADQEDAKLGWAFGTIVLLSAAIVFGTSLAILLTFYRV